ncbi:MAG: NADH-quinone oxidoreductase subunit M [Gammaproteobacteria bacterium]|nr:NADH-quinone oxidoreductase subunit M [Gammaproteobacteria bacterium]
MSYLTLLLFIPAAGSVLLMLIPRQFPVLVRFSAIFISAMTLAYSWSLLNHFDASAAGMQLVESHPWSHRLGTTFLFGIDGFSYPLVLLASLLCLVALMASANLEKQTKGYYSLMLLLEAAMLGVFTAQDWALFYVFWELTLIPLFFLIDRWGGKRRHGAALNFVLYTMGGSVFMLISLLVTFDNVPGHSFAMAAMADTARHLPVEAQVMIFLGLLVGFGVKMPIFPIHGWLPLAHVEAPSPVSILLSGILLKMGSYGLIRATAMLPGAAIALQSVLVALALFSLLYGGLLAWRQTDLKAMIAYSSISHMAVVLLGISTLNHSGLTGAVSQMIAHGLVAGALFLLIGQLYERTHTRDIRDYSSLVRVTPRFAFFTTLTLVAAIGMPGTAGFIAELHALIGGYERWGWLVLLLSIGMLISAAYAIRTAARLFTGPVRPGLANTPDLQLGESVAAGVLATGTLVLGIFPVLMLGLVSASVHNLVRSFTG